MAALVEYSLPDVDSPVGIFKVKVYSETEGLTVPTKQTILTIGEKEETSDRAPSVQEMTTLSFSVMDTMAAYPAGFWFTVSKSRTLVKFTLMEGAAETYYFFGRIDNKQNEWTDHYANSTDTEIVRSGTIVLTSLERDVFEGTTLDLQNEVYSHRFDNTGDGPEDLRIAKVIRVIDIFNSLLVVTGYNADFNHADTEFVYDPAKPDFKYYNRFGTAYTFKDLWFVASTWDIDVENPSYFFEGTSQWSAKYHYLKDFVSVLLDTFQLILRFDYDVDTGRVGIKLYQRGHSFPDTKNSVMPKFYARQFTLASDTYGTSFQAVDFWSANIQRWVSKQFSDSVQSIAVPDYIQIESQSFMLFRAGKTTSLVDSIDQATSLFGSFAIPEEGEYPSFVDTYNDSGSDRILSIDYYNYTTNTYVTVSNPGDGGAIAQAVVGYQYGRFAEERQSCVAIYKNIKVGNGTTTSHANARSLMRTLINDGTGNATYWARTVNTDAANSQLTVTWIKE